MRRTHRDKGQELVEFALLSPVLFLLLFGLMELGMAVWHYNTLSIAAREGARAALVMPEDQRVQAAIDAAESYAQSMRVNGVVAEAELTAYVITDPETGFTTSLPTISVRVSYQHPSVTGLLGTIPMQASSTMLIE